MIKGIQIVGVLVGLYLFIQTSQNYRKGNITLKKTISLSGIWTIVIVLFLNPALAELALPILSTQDMLMTVQVLGILLSYILITHLLMQFSKLEGKVNTLAQNLALKHYIEEQDDDLNRD